MTLPTGPGGHEGQRRRASDRETRMQVMAEDECWDLLAGHSVGRLALVRGGAPLVFPVTYAVSGRSVVFRTAGGPKFDAVDARAPAAFEVDELDEAGQDGASVVVHGHLREVTNHQERKRLEWLPLHPWAPGDKEHLVRLDAEAVTGRRIVGRTHSEVWS